QIHGTEYAECIDARGVCPLCQAATDRNSDVRPAQLTMFLSVLSLTPSEKEFNGQIEQRYYRNPLALKSSQAQPFIDVLLAAEQRNGGPLRGVVLNLVRGSEQMSARVGAPAMVNGADGRLYDIISEEDLASFASREIKSREGQVLAAAG